MNYAVEMGSDVMMHIPSFSKDCFRYSNLIGGYTDKQTAWR
jgi:hypothetical protein